MKHIGKVLRIFAFSTFLGLLLPITSFADEVQEEQTTEQPTTEQVTTEQTTESAVPTQSLVELEAQLDGAIVEETDVDSKDNKNPAYANCIVKIVSAYEDEDGNLYYVKQGTGFVVGVGSGSSDSNNKKYVITDYGIIEGEKEYVDTIKIKYSLGDTKLSLKHFAVGDMGVFTELKITSYSEETRYAIMEPSSGFADKDILRLGGDEDIKDQNFRVDVEGYSGRRSIYLDNGSVEDRGFIVYHRIAIEDIFEESYYNDTIEYFYVGMPISSGMAGAPVIDNETGCVVGMFIYEKGDERIRAISIKNIRQVLDALAINYLVASDDITYDRPTAEQRATLKELIVDNKDYITKIKKNRYTASSWNGLYDAISNADEVYMNGKSTAKKYDDTIAALKKARKKLKTKAFKWKVINVIAAVVIFVILIILTRILKKRKRLKAERKIISNMGN